MNNLHIERSGGSDRDYELVARIEAAVSGRPASARKLREIDSGKYPGKFHERGLVWLDGECIGATLHFDLPGDIHICLYSLIPEYQNEGFDASILERLLNQALTKGANEVRTSARTDCFAKLAAVEDLGFEKNGEWYVTSELDLSGFDPEIGLSKAKMLNEQGIEILSAAQLATRDIDWLYQQYGFLTMPEMPPFEEFKKKADAPEWFPETQYAALLGAQTIGVTSIDRILEEPGTGQNNLTIVVYELQGKGIATALKCASLAAAKEAGIKTVRTCNAGASKMLSVNRRLGYRVIEEEIGFAKRLDP